MIFEKITQLTSKEEFIEKILIYIRLVEVVAERKGFNIPKVSVPSEDMIVEMMEMGLLDKSEDIKDINKIVDENTRLLEDLNRINETVEEEINKLLNR